MKNSKETAELLQKACRFLLGGFLKWLFAMTTWGTGLFFAISEYLYYPLFRHREHGALLASGDLAFPQNFFVQQFPPPSRSLPRGEGEGKRKASSGEKEKQKLPRDVFSLGIRGWFKSV